jgi:DNA processing protein
MPDLRDSLTPVPPPIKVSALPEMQRMMIGLIRECRGRHLLVTPDALLHVARETAPDEIPNIGSVLGLLGALELNGVVEREAGVLKLSDRLV